MNFYKTYNVHICGAITATAAESEHESLMDAWIVLFSGFTGQSKQKHISTTLTATFHLVKKPFLLITHRLHPPSVFLLESCSNQQITNFPAFPMWEFAASESRLAHICLGQRCLKPSLILRFQMFLCCVQNDFHCVPLQFFSTIIGFPDFSAFLPPAGSV